MKHLASQLSTTESQGLQVDNSKAKSHLQRSCWGSCAVYGGRIQFKVESSCSLLYAKLLSEGNSVEGRGREAPRKLIYKADIRRPSLVRPQLREERVTLKPTPIKIPSRREQS